MLTGSYGGGHEVVITGSGFPQWDAESVTVTVCDLVAEVTEVTGTEIEFATPSHTGIILVLVCSNSSLIAQTDVSIMSIL